MNSLIEAIKQQQKREGLTDTELAKRIGLKGRSLWCEIKSGRRQPGLKFLRGIAREFPDLKPLVDAEIYDKLLFTILPENAQNQHRGLLKRLLVLFYKGISKLRFS